MMCPVCKQDKDGSEFGKAPQRKSGYTYTCKACASAYGAQYRARNAEKLKQAKKVYALRRPEVGAAAKRRYAEENKDRTLASKLAWKMRNPEKDRAARAAWRKANPKRSRAWHDRQVRENPTYAMICRLRSRTRKALRARKEKTTLGLLGCSPQEFRVWIEQQFSEGMTWENRNLWELDHKKPFAAINLDDPDQVAEVCHYTNIQPLWRAENRRKAGRYLAEDQV